MPYSWNGKNVTITTRADVQDFDQTVTFDGAAVWNALGGTKGYGGGHFTVYAEGFSDTGISLVKTVVPNTQRLTDVELYHRLSSDFFSGDLYIYQAQQEYVQVGEQRLRVGSRVKQVGYDNNGNPIIEINGTKITVSSDILVGNKPSVGGYGIGDTFVGYPGKNWFAKTYTSSLQQPPIAFEINCTIVSLDMSLNRVAFVSDAGVIGCADVSNLGQAYSANDTRYVTGNDIRIVSMYTTSSGGKAVLPIQVGTQVPCGGAENGRRSVLWGSTVYWIEDSRLSRIEPNIDGWTIDSSGYVIDKTLSGYMPNQPCTVYTLDLRSTSKRIRLDKAGGTQVSSSQISKTPGEFSGYYWWAYNVINNQNGIPLDALCTIISAPIGDKYEIKTQGDVGDQKATVAYSDLHNSKFSRKDINGGSDWGFFNVEGYLYPDSGPSFTVRGATENQLYVVGDVTGWYDMDKITTKPFTEVDVYAYTSLKEKTSLYNKDGSSALSTAVGTKYTQKKAPREDGADILLTNGYYLKDYTTELKSVGGWTTQGFKANGAEGAVNGYVIWWKGLGQGFELNTSISVVGLGTDSVLIKNGANATTTTVPKDNIRTTKFDITTDNLGQVYIGEKGDKQMVASNGVGPKWFYIVKKMTGVLVLGTSDSDMNTYLTNKYTIWTTPPKWEQGYNIYTKLSSISGKTIYVENKTTYYTFQWKTKPDEWVRDVNTGNTTTTIINRAPSLAYTWIDGSTKYQADSWLIGYKPNIVGLGEQPEEFAKTVPKDTARATYKKTGNYKVTGHQISVLKAGSGYRQYTSHSLTSSNPITASNINETTEKTFYASSMSLSSSTITLYKDGTSTSGISCYYYTYNNETRCIPTSTLGYSIKKTEAGWTDGKLYI